MESEIHPGSFRDPSGFLFLRAGELYRQINHGYRQCYEKLFQSGLYDHLVKESLLIPHKEVDAEPEDPTSAYKVIMPEPVGFVSYGYEWCFSQLKDAALATLAIQDAALKHGMVLKDASVYNIQFHRGAPILIDTLSFDEYTEGTAWVAYRQFCQHFLAPLALMSRKDVRLGGLLRLHIDGIPLDLTCSLLPARTWLFPPLLFHLLLHSRSQRKYADNSDAIKSTSRRLSRRSLVGIIDNLRSAVRSLYWKPIATEWAEYYAATNYTADAMSEKARLVDEYLEEIKPRDVWDLGGNTGRFSRLASGRGIRTVMFDIDPVAVEACYQSCKRRGETFLLPLLADLTNPSPSQGWAHQERSSLSARGPVDTTLALALVHHLAISNNVPLPKLARYFRSICRNLIVEFVPKSDSQVRKLLATREDVFPDYHEQAFEKAFSQCFELARSDRIAGTERKLYWFVSSE